MEEARLDMGGELEALRLEMNKLQSQQRNDVEQMNKEFRKSYQDVMFSFKQNDWMEEYNRKKQEISSQQVQVLSFEDNEDEVGDHVNGREEAQRESERAEEEES